MLPILVVCLASWTAASTFTFDAARGYNWEHRHLPLWPYPQSVTHGSGSKPVAVAAGSAFSIKLQAVAADSGTVSNAQQLSHSILLTPFPTSGILKSAAERYAKLFFPFGDASPVASSAALTALEVETESGDEVVLDLGFDESYSLTLTGMSPK
jgi:hypothetical protein